jgi:hypothetical protein
MKNPWVVVSGFKHDNRLKCHRGIVSQWTFQLGLNVTVDETWVDVTSRHPTRVRNCALCVTSVDIVSSISCSEALVNLEVVALFVVPYKKKLFRIDTHLPHSHSQSNFTQLKV